MKKVFVSFLLALTMVFSLGTVEQAHAQNGGFFSNLFGNGNRNRTRSRSGMSTAQRAENISIQAALNFFDLDAGAEDGILGRRTRAAVSAFQQALDLPETGQLTGPQKEFLLSSHGVIADGGVNMNLRLLSNTEGALGVLKSLYAEQNPPAGITLGPVRVQAHSMRSLCINIEASGDINLVKAQFCNLRHLAIEQTGELLESIQTRSARMQVTEKCSELVASIMPVAAGIATRASEEVIDELVEWVGDSGMTPDTLSRFAGICLGAGYSANAPDTALAALLALNGSQDMAYAELLSYHIAFGFGFDREQNFALASEWLQHTVVNIPVGALALTGQESSQRAPIIVDAINILDAAN